MSRPLIHCAKVPGLGQPRAVLDWNPALLRLWSADLSLFFV